MRVVVLGSGVIGVTTAWFLSRAGHEVEVVDRQRNSALEASYANAGEVSPGYAAPWAAPGIPFKAVKWAFSRYSPLVLHPFVDPDTLVWMVRVLSHCNQASYEINKSRMVRIAQYSRDALKSLRSDTGITYDERMLGTLQIFRNQQQVDEAERDRLVLDRYGIGYEVLDRAGCVAAEPALASVQHKIAGGLRLPGDETGDCLKFTRVLASMAATAGVVFRCGVTVTALQVEATKVTGVLTSDGIVKADAFVLALGSSSPLLARDIGVRLPVLPVKGYSITLPITDEAAAPVSTVMDETYKVAVTRLGSRIRAAGTAELAGYDLTLSPRRVRTIRHVVQDLFPGAGMVDYADAWCGLRPMTPDGTPILGGSRYGNLWINTGHGTLGWTMACGSGRITADLVSGRLPDIDMDGLTMSRYGEPDRLV